jgi:hypothetical protein
MNYSTLKNYLTETYGKAKQKLFPKKGLITIVLSDEQSKQNSTFPTDFGRDCFQTYHPDY